MKSSLMSDGIPYSIKISLGHKKAQQQLLISTMSKIRCYLTKPKFWSLAVVSYDFLVLFLYMKKSYLDWSYDIFRISNTFCRQEILFILHINFLSQKPSVKLLPASKV